VSPAFPIVALLWSVSEVSIGIRAIRRVGSRKDDRLSGPALVGGMVLAVWLGYVLTSLVPRADITTLRPMVIGLGVALAIAGIVLRQYAVASLGRYFTTRVMTSPGQRVIDTGPYRFVRHPSYTGLLMTVLGLLLISANWLSMGCFVVALPGFGYRIWVEEHALANAIGEPYREYMRRTKRLLPFII